MDGNLEARNRNPLRPAARPRLRRTFHLAALLGFSFLAGCRTLPPLPPANLSAPDWTVLQGQAIWKPAADAPEIAGDLLVATNRTGATFIQFTKTPFPLIIAQSTSNRWQIEAPVENRRFARNGAPPQRVMWFQLPRALGGNPPQERWRWTARNENWRLENPATGERLEGFVQLQPAANPQ